jgi:hypothetical protein
MVNNHQKEAKSHSPLFFVVVFILLMVFVTNTTKAQKIKKYYVSSKQDKGTLFFIRPQKGFKNKHLGSRLTYDITCFSGADSLTFNFLTLINKSEIWTVFVCLCLRKEAV